MGTITDLMDGDKFAKVNDIELLEVEKGCAVAKMAVSPKHLNGVGVVQGGAIFTLADFCCAAAANSYGNTAISLDANINFVKGVSSGILTARATEVYRRRTIALYKVIVTADDDVIVATFQSTMFIKRLDTNMLK